MQSALSYATSRHCRGLVALNDHRSALNAETSCAHTVPFVTLCCAFPGELPINLGASMMKLEAAVGQDDANWFGFVYAPAQDNSVAGDVLVGEHSQGAQTLQPETIGSF